MSIEHLYVENKKQNEMTEKFFWILNNLHLLQWGSDSFEDNCLRFYVHSFLNRGATFCREDIDYVQKDFSEHISFIEQVLSGKKKSSDLPHCGGAEAKKEFDVLKALSESKPDSGDLPVAAFFYFKQEAHKDIDLYSGLECWETYDSYNDNVNYFIKLSEKFTCELKEKFEKMKQTELYKDFVIHDGRTKDE